jgi:hypothetical protein
MFLIIPLFLMAYLAFKWSMIFWVMLKRGGPRHVHQADFEARTPSEILKDWQERVIYLFVGLAIAAYRFSRTGSDARGDQDDYFAWATIISGLILAIILAVWVHQLRVDQDSATDGRLPKSDEGPILLGRVRNKP